MLSAIIRLNPSRDWRSRLASLRHNIWLVIETTLVSGIVTSLWGGCFYLGWLGHAHHESDVVMLSTSILVSAAMFAIVAALIFAETWQKLGKLSRAIHEGDEVGFMLLRDEKISTMMHVVLGFFSLAVLAQFGLAHYANLTLGAMVMFFTTSCFTAYFIAVLELQSPKNILWIRTHAPAHWLTQDSQEFFRKYREEKTKSQTAP